MERLRLKDKDLTDHLGLPPGSMAKWKYDGSQVYLKYIVEISQFLGTSPNYLFLGTEKQTMSRGLHLWKMK